MPIHEAIRVCPTGGNVRGWCADGEGTPVSPPRRLLTRPASLRPRTETGEEPKKLRSAVVPTDHTCLGNAAGGRPRRPPADHQPL